MIHTRFWKYGMLAIAVISFATFPAGAGLATIGSVLQKKDPPSDKRAKTDLAGKWDLNVSSNQGPMAGTAEFKIAPNGTITGTIVSPYGTSPVTSGSAKDVTFTIKYNVTDAQGALTEITMSGSVDGNSIKGFLTVGGDRFGFTGIRSSGAKNTK